MDVASIGRKHMTACMKQHQPMGGLKFVHGRKRQRERKKEEKKGEREKRRGKENLEKRKKESERESGKERVRERERKKERESQSLMPSRIFLTLEPLQIRLLSLLHTLSHIAFLQEEKTSE